MAELAKEGNTYGCWNDKITTLVNDLKIGALAENGRGRRQSKTGIRFKFFSLGEEGDGYKLGEKPAAILGRS